MISNEEGWNYIAVEKLPVLLKGITSKHNGDNYCLNCLHSFRTKDKHEYITCENTDFCIAAMPSEDTKTLEFNQYCKSDKALFMIYAILNLKRKDWWM